MRIRNLILCLLLCIVSASAKDVITKTDGTKLDAKVEEITETLIKYRKASNLSGPIYTIPIASVSTIQYENGDTDTFNESVSTSPLPIPQSSSPSDEELMRLADFQTFNDQPGYISDAELLNIYQNGQYPESIRKKAKTYKLVGWIGGATIFGVLVPFGIALLSDAYVEGGITIGMGLIGSAAWTLGFNLKANSLMKRARQMQSYSATLIENEIMKFGNNSLTAGINVMGNRIPNSHSLGLSLDLNF